MFFGAGAGERFEAAVYFASKLAGKAGNEEFLRKAREKIHPDVIVVEPEIAEDKKGRIREKEIILEQIQEARDRLKFFPYELSKKFCVIKKAEKLNDECSNALLKILEEPSVSSIFILLANDVGSVLPTISSRCAILRFPQTKLPEWDEKNREKFKNIFKEEIFEKFGYIEKISKDKNELIKTLKDWEAVAAEGLRKLVLEERGISTSQGSTFPLSSAGADSNSSRSNLAKGNRERVGKVVGLIGSLREAINQLEQTNASPRSIGERLVLEMSSRK